MPRPEEPQRLLERHIAALGEQKARLELALAELIGPAVAGEGRKAARGGSRADVLADLKANPGSTVGEVARRIGVKPAHTRTIVTCLVEQELMTKEGRRYTLDPAAA